MSDAKSTSEVCQRETAFRVEMKEGGARWEGKGSREEDDDALFEIALSYFAKLRGSSKLEREGVS